MWDIILKVLDYTTRIIILPSILWGAYLYIENRKLKSFEFEKEAKIKRAELKELYFQKTGVSSEIFNDLDLRIGKAEAELEYYQKMKRYKWIFSK